MTFFFYFGRYLRNCGNSHIFGEENQSLWKFAYFYEMMTFFLSSRQISLNFAMLPLFLVHTFEFKEIKFSCPPKICLCPPFPVTPSWRRAWFNPTRNLCHSVHTNGESFGLLPTFCHLIVAAGFIKQETYHSDKKFAFFSSGHSIFAFRDLTNF